jgi:FkbM family methyltransferase
MKFNSRYALSRSKAAGLRALRELSALPLRALDSAQRGRVLEQLSASMVTRVEVPEGILSFVTPTPLLQARAGSVLSKEPDTIRWIDSFERNDVFWDVGANVGVFSLYAARRGVRVLAFEPSAGNYMILCKNVELNSFESWVVPYCVALAGQTGLGVLNSPTHELGAALHQFGGEGEISRYWKGGKCSCAQGMIGFTIDDFIAQFQPPFPTRLKLDVDGLEEPILHGALRTLRDPRLQSVMAELTISDVVERNRAIACLSDAGFYLVMCGEVQESRGESAANHFFARTGLGE